MSWLATPYSLYHRRLFLDILTVSTYTILPSIAGGLVLSINVEFTNPTATERKKIWWNHLKTDKIHVPLSTDVNIDYLAETYELCGREIKNVVKNACVSAALRKQEIVTQQDFDTACVKAVDERIRVNSAKDQTKTGGISVSEEKRAGLKDAIQKKIDTGTVNIIKSDGV